MKKPDDRFRPACFVLNAFPVARPQAVKSWPDPELHPAVPQLLLPDPELSRPVPELSLAVTEPFEKGPELSTGVTELASAVPELCEKVPELSRAVPELFEKVPGKTPSVVHLLDIFTPKTRFSGFGHFLSRFPDREGDQKGPAIIPNFGQHSSITQTVHGCGVLADRPARGPPQIKSRQPKPRI